MVIKSFKEIYNEADQKLDIKDKAVFIEHAKGYLNLGDVSILIAVAGKHRDQAYVLSRYRWGKPVDSEKSRFIDEIKEEYLQNNVIQRSISKDFSQKSQFNKVGIRYKKPETRPAKNFVKLKSSSSKSNLFDNKLIVGNIVVHERFGKGEVISIEGQGGDRKAEIMFEKDGLKKLLLRFSRLEIIS